MLKLPYYFISFTFSVTLGRSTATLLCYHKNNANISFLVITLRKIINGRLSLKARIFNIAVTS